METLEKLPKHLNTAVNAIQKQIDKYEAQKGKLFTKIQDLESQGEWLESEIEGLKGQIAKLKGE